MKEIPIKKKIEKLLSVEDREPAITSLALRLEITENYLRMIQKGQGKGGIEAGKRIAREIDALYKKVVEK